jgi:hypothetical protein
MTAQIGVLEKVGELALKAKYHEEQFNAIVGQITELMSGFGVRSSVLASLPTANVPSSSAPVKRRGRPPGSGKKIAPPINIEGTTVKRRGRPPGSGKKIAPPINGTTTATTTSEIHLLPKIVWEILTRNPSEWRRVLPTVPEDANGLKAIEIWHIIKNEGSWVSDAKTDPATQISSTLRKLSSINRVTRGEHCRYSVVKKQPEVVVKTEEVQTEVPVQEKITNE